MRRSDILDIAVVDPADNPILIKEMPNQGTPVPTTPVAKPTTGGSLPANQVGGSRSGVGRLQKAGLGSSVYDTVAKSRPVAKTTSVSKPATTGGYDGSGINPSANRPRVRPIGNFGGALSKLGRGSGRRR